MAKKSETKVTPEATAIPQGKPKKVCPITKADFLAKAKPMTIMVDGRPMVAGVKEFSTGSFGWYLSGKTSVVLEGGVTVDIQLGFNLTLVGSKEAK